MSIENLKASATEDLSGRVALVTGGGTGIGLMIARGFVANNAKVYIAGRREDVLEQIATEHPQMIPLKMDVTDKNSITNAMGVIEKAEGKVDILVNNAGIAKPYSEFITNKSAPENSNLGPSLFELESWEDWSKTLEVNTIAPFFVTTGFSELLAKGAKLRGEGETSVVINISSAAADRHSSMNAIAYGTSKAGLDHLTKTMAYEFATNNVPIRVVCISPGPFPSEITGTTESIDRAIRDGNFWGGTAIPPNKRSGREKELSSAAVWLSSSGGAYTNGIILRVDGGLALTNA
ncbi:hypothetical protein VKT23_004825 [Stygiomarasmius scandens]|uniref:NAD(P)-binding protein n=1 Tax=Marasmiellus scandens TaxID=2682957 RepID=A0ABR1JSB9_9AGAR